MRLEELVASYQAQRQELDRQGVYFLGTITEEEAERFSKSLYLMASERQFNATRPITVYINSSGGSVGAGLAMMQMMDEMRRSYNVKINTVITGYAYSMGAIIFEAGDRRTMGIYSTMMLHSSSWTVSGEDEKIFRDYARLAELNRKLVAELFARRTGLHTARWWDRYIYSGRDRFLSAAECLKLRLVDEVPGLNTPAPDSPTQGVSSSSYPH